MARKITEKIKIWGIVQGVGFRPFVAKVAKRFDMKGEVRNIGGLVEIQVTDTEKHTTEFLKELQINKPLPAEIVHIKREEVKKREFMGFTIVESEEGDREATMIPADLAICDHCLKEMNDPTDPRFKHPFISCMVCGPRYSITRHVPYDRENTSMDDFSMCAFCRGEYEDIANRRHHAQTISCHQCGPQMEFKLNELDLLTEKPILEKAAAVLKEGRVIAFKSVGGYNLVANPFEDNGVADLRKIKKREAKPFAIMFRDIEEIKNYCKVSQVEESLLTSGARPILLLERKSIEELEAMKPGNYRELEKSRFIGAFLPSMGAQYILLELFGGPLIMTSANLSDMPMIRDEAEMFKMLDEHPEIAEVFYNSRQIVTGVDDSVVRVIDGQPQMIRRSKGYVPIPLYMEGGRGEVFAAGGQLKNSFCLSKGPFVYPSQHFGDLDSIENQKNYEETLVHMEKLLRIKPDRVVCDLHPLYYTTAFAEKYAAERNLPLVKIQHHHAHVASVMAEHRLEGQVIGVSFDGTGYGEDGAIWGGEFLLCDGASYERVNHLRYVNLIGGDTSMKDGWKSALSFIHDRHGGYVAEEEGILVDIDDMIQYATDNGTLEHREIELTERALESKINIIRSSSMGRLFDGVSAMLGICDHNSYEGQCAILLEDAAARARKNPGKEEADDLALAFHLRITHMIVEEVKKIDDRFGVKQVALTGGVFQNKILMEGALAGLRSAGYSVYYNVSVSPNDGGIALGQAYIGAKGGDIYGNR